MIQIIGAGLCGLAIGYKLQQAGIAYTILEARQSAGGRIQPAGEPLTHQDLGPSWVWPYAQPIVETWFDELGLHTYAQYDDGDGLLDADHAGSAQRQFLPGQHGIARVNGGTYAIIRALLDKVAGHIEYNRPVESCDLVGSRVCVNLKTEENAVAENSIQTDKLVIATPPRIAAELLPVNRAELSDVIKLLHQAPTWMAPHAKVVMQFESAFWREQGLSGRIASQVGPMVEVHDHSGPEGLPAALFGFVGVPASGRTNNEALKSAVQQQLIRCFGKDAPQPTTIIIKDWAHEPYTTSEADLSGPMTHPSVMKKQVRASYWNNKLWFASSETSPVSPGLIEGAFARADEVAEQIIKLSQ